MSFVSSIVGGILGSNAAGDASSQLQRGAQQARGVISQGQNNASNFLTNEFGNTTSNFNPYLSLGSTSANNLQGLLSNGFQAPTLQQAENTPGYQFNLQQGTNAILNNASATGNLMSGTTGTALEQYGQGLAQNTYQQAYNNALSGYNANLTGLLGGTQIGQGSTSTLGMLGNQAAGINSNIQLGGSEAQAQQINNAASAAAYGTLGQANGWANAAGGMIGGLGALAGGFGNLDTTGGSSFGEQVGNFFGGMGG